MSHWSVNLIIDNIHDLMGTIRLIEQEIESLASHGEYAKAQDLYQELLDATRRLGELEQSIAL
jgi:hypothetical protein